MKTKPLYTVGDRVRIHPASDWFMRGVTHGVITSYRTPRIKRLLEPQGPNAGMTVYFVRPDTVGIQAPSKLRMKMTSDYILEVVK